MTAEDLKKYSVKVQGGSGCFFQPMTTNYTYILTAKHLFEIEQQDEITGDELTVTLPSGSDIEIFKHNKIDNGWIETKIPFVLNIGENYFQHPNADIAILKIPYDSGFESIFVELMIDKNVGYELCGFPEQNKENDPGEKYTTHFVERILASGNYCHGAQVFGNLNQDNIIGMSGGGFLKAEKNYISILGIQSKMASRAIHQAGQIGFIPIDYFNDIISAQENNGKLDSLLPPYMLSFSFFEDDIFNIKTGLLEEAKKNKLTSILKEKAKEIGNSDITPNVIREYLNDKLLLIEQSKFELQGKNIWIMWLELFVILNVSKERIHNYADFPDIFKKIRMFYSNIDDDFWINHLDELHKQDYTGLEKGGLVIVATNREAIGENEDVLDLDKIATNIARARQEYELDQIGESIDNALDFPFDKYKFVNISKFKERTVKDIEEEFVQDSIQNCLLTLKDLYEQFIPKW